MYSVGAGHVGTMTVANLVFQKSFMVALDTSHEPLGVYCKAILYVDSMVYDVDPAICTSKLLQPIPGTT